MKIEIIENMSTSQLIEVFVMTGSIENENVYTVRGWLMDELEKRNPEAFDAWLDSTAEDEGLKKYYGV